MVVEAPIELVLLLLVLSEFAPLIDFSSGSLNGELEAIASLTRSCLLNFAFADSKSKSVSGTSIFLLCV